MSGLRSLGAHPGALRRQFATSRIDFSASTPACTQDSSDKKFCQGDSSCRCAPATDFLPRVRGLGVPRQRVAHVHAGAGSSLGRAGGGFASDGLSTRDDTSLDRSVALTPPVGNFEAWPHPRLWARGVANGSCPPCLGPCRRYGPGGNLFALGVPSRPPWAQGQEGFPVRRRTTTGCWQAAAPLLRSCPGRSHSADTHCGVPPRPTRRSTGCSRCGPVVRDDDVAVLGVGVISAASGCSREAGSPGRCAPRPAPAGRHPTPCGVRPRGRYPGTPCRAGRPGERAVARGSPLGRQLGRDGQ